MRTLLFALAVLAVVLAIINFPAIARFLGIGRARAVRPGRGIEGADPLALLNQAVEDGVTSIQNAKKGLEHYGGLISSVQRQVESGEKEKVRLEGRIQEILRSGDPARTASEFALVLADVEQNLRTNREQLRKHKEIAENLARQVELGQAKVAAARLKAARLGLELEQSEREKQMASFASAFSFNPEGLDTDLARAEELINQKIDENRAAGHVTADIAKQAFAGAEEELERRVAAAEILERLRKERLRQES